MCCAREQRRQPQSHWYDSAGRAVAPRLKCVEVCHGMFFPVCRDRLFPAALWAACNSCTSSCGGATAAALGLTLGGTASRLASLSCCTHAPNVLCCCAVASLFCC